MNTNNQISSYYCCSVRLRTAGIIIGCISGIYSLIFNIIILLPLINYIETVLQLSSCVSPDTIVKSLYVYRALTTIDLVTSFMLVLGIIRARHLFLVPWLFNTGLATLNHNISFVYLSLSTLSGYYTFGCVNRALLFLGLATIISFIGWFTILKLHRKIKLREQLLSAIDHILYTKFLRSITNGKIENQPCQIEEQEQFPPPYTTLARTSLQSMFEDQKHSLDLHENNAENYMPVNV